MFRRHIILLIAIRPSDGDVKPSGPLGAFRLWAGTGFHLLPFFHHHHHPTQHNNTTQTVTLAVTLTSTFSHTYTDTHPTRNVVCPSGAWLKNRPHLMPSIHLAWNPKHVIVQWVGIGTHTCTHIFILLCIAPTLLQSKWAALYVFRVTRYPGFTRTIPVFHNLSWCPKKLLQISKCPGFLKCKL